MNHDEKRQKNLKRQKNSLFYKKAGNGFLCYNRTMKWSPKPEVVPEIKFPKSLIEQAQKKIMTYQEYVETGPHKLPDHFEVSGKKKHLFFYQAEHFNNPENVQVEEIQNFFRDFQPDIVCVEGVFSAQRAYNDPKFFTEASFYEVAKGGEAGVTLKLALENNIEFFCPEPSGREQALYLKNQGVSFKECACLFVLRGHTKPSLRALSKRSLEQAIDDKCNRFLLEESVWDNDIVLNFTTIDQYIRDLTGRAIKEYTDRELYKLTTPLPDKEGNFGPLNRIDNMVTVFRDSYIIEKIVEKLEIHDRLFITYGGSHGVVQKPALEYLLKE